MVDTTIKNQTFCFIGIYASNISREGAALLRRIDSCPMASRRVILAGDLNAPLDLDINQTESRLGTNNSDIKPFRDFMDRLDLVNKFSPRWYCGLELLA